MIKNLLLIVLTLSLASSIRIKKIQTNFEKSMSKIESTQFGKVLLSAIQLHATVGASADKIVALIEKVRDELHTEQSAHDGEHQQAQADFDKEISDAEALIVKLTSSIESNEDALETSKKTLQEKIDLRAEKKDERKELRQERKAAIAARAAAKADYETKHGEAIDKREAVRVALEIIEDELRTEDNPQPNAEFVQTNIKNSLKKLNSILKKGKQNYYIPMINSLVQVALSQNYVGHDSLNRLVELLNNLRDDILNVISTLETNEATAVENHRAYLEATNQSISNLTTHIQTLRQEISDLRETIDQLKITLENLRNDLTSTQTALAGFKQAKAEEQAYYEKSTNERNAEIAALNEAIEILEGAESSLNDIRDYEGNELHPDSEN